MLIEGCLTQKKIAEQLKITEQTICNWKKDREFTDEHDRLLKDSFKAYIPEARNSLIELMRNAQSEMVKLNATNSVLEKAGINPKQQIETKNVNLNTEMTAEEADKIIEEWESKHK